MEEQDIVKAAIGIVAVIVAAIGGTALYSKKTSKSKTYQTTQKDISITGNNNKIVGGDDNASK